MNILKKFVTVATFALLVTLAIYTQFGCKGGTHAENALTAGTYSAELDACVVKAKTKAESQTCRCEVSTRYHRACDPASGGTSSDAGSDR